MFKLSRSKAAAVTVTTFGLWLGASAPALADSQPGPNDVVGTGSDTVQFAGNFLFEGDTSGNPGYNVGKTNRVYSFDATGDASGRTSYADNSTNSALFSPTAVLRQGSNPVTRPNGSGSGIASLYTAPYSTGPVVQFARASRLPNCTENTAAVNAGFGGLHSYRMGTEALAMARLASGSNAPAGLTVQQVLNIYNGTWTTWGQIPGYGGGAPNATIVPLLPQSGSGTRGVFDADMKAANGGTAVTYGPNVQVTQENDYNAFLISGSPTNTISVFSGARITLNDSGYFGNAAKNQVVAMTGAAPNGGSTYVNNRPLFFVVKQNDVNSTTPFQPGSSQNFVRQLFSGAGNMLASPIFAANIQSAGFTASYSDTGAPGVQGTSCN